jgi:hypothetical protein
MIAPPAILAAPEVPPDGVMNGVIGIIGTVCRRIDPNRYHVRILGPAG